MFTILYLGLLVMCCLPWYFHKKMQYSTDYNKICVAGMVCSVLFFLWTFMYLFDSIGILFDYESIFENIRSTQGLEGAMWSLHGDVMIAAENSYDLTIFLILIFSMLLPLSILSCYDYYRFWQSCYKICPKCNEKIKVKAKLCHYCGYEIQEEDIIQEEIRLLTNKKNELLNKKIKLLKKYNYLCSPKAKYTLIILSIYLTFHTYFILNDINVDFFSGFSVSIGLGILFYLCFRFLLPLQKKNLHKKIFSIEAQINEIAGNKSTTLPKNNINTCRKCGTELVDVKFCTNCKGVIRQSQELLNEEKLCPKCGQAMINEKYCTTCKTVIRKKIY